MKKWGQMSESVIVIGLLCISGGFQDAYTYICRDGVFANAQTGNIVLMGQHFAEGDLKLGLRYLFPVVSFLLGIILAELIKKYCKEFDKIHWRQIVLAIEILILFLAGFIPEEMDLPANMLVSLVCAMQVQSFRKLNGNAYATTMCIGNLRTATELWFSYHTTKKPELKKKSMLYYGFIGIFAVGAAVGSIMAGLFEKKAIWFSCLVLIVAFCLMFIKESQEEGSQTDLR
ncbi:Uncharacterized membrane protein YoaK, UPF0700 family [Anaerocolumna jejuensis DSM 15929]|uniref:Uncharacterized membrane protein YoaK, UPF0700 family n=1 Tax=Anaerocolumna jejuensis DSM 15929 TaxID=1121322 RepID=A0A1M6SRN0_9FIRM|nr:YoaK family protein [Anaerocolumna jejuensis]SHK47248.1 Uncharacterized membrane protein YoaK, UPF0700 family [Anaerocolumna jejuensis DSM 15929]